MIPFVYFFLTTVKFYFKKTVKFILFFLADKTKDYIIAFLVGKKKMQVWITLHPLVVNHFLGLECIENVWILHTSCKVGMDLMLDPFSIV